VILPTFQFAIRPLHNATQVAKLLDDSASSPTEQVTVNGFVRSVRSQKSRSFVALGDGSSIEPLQAVLPADRADGYAKNPFVSASLMY
jgi:aspartyl/asparaginyl-tRNA synthetase